MEAALETDPPKPSAAPEAPPVKLELPPAGVPKALYTDAQDALKAVRDGYLYWTGKLTDSSLQLSYAVLGANWVVFGSLDRILGNTWSKLSVFLVILSLGLSVVGARVIGEKLLGRINYAESNPARWNAEFTATAGKQDPWPFTADLDSWGRWMRGAKTWLPLIAGVLFVVALIQQ